MEKGLAHGLYESNTIYLAASTKEASTEKSKVAQYYNPTELAKRRAFSFTSSYINEVLHDHISKAKAHESLISDASSLQSTSFEKLILARLSSFQGKTDKELCEKFGRKYSGNKAQWSTLAYRMLGTKSQQNFKRKYHGKDNSTWGKWEAKRAYVFTAFQI